MSEAGRADKTGGCLPKAAARCFLPAGRSDGHAQSDGICAYVYFVVFEHVGEGVAAPDVDVVEADFGDGVGFEGYHVETAFFFFFVFLVFFVVIDHFCPRVDAQPAHDAGGEEELVALGGGQLELEHDGDGEVEAFEAAARDVFGIECVQVYGDEVAFRFSEGEVVVVEADALVFKAQSGDQPEVVAGHETDAVREEVELHDERVAPVGLHAFPFPFGRFREVEEAVADAAPVAGESFIRMLGALFFAGVEDFVHRPALGNGDG